MRAEQPHQVLGFQIGEDIHAQHPEKQRHHQQQRKAVQRVAHIDGPRDGQKFLAQAGCIGGKEALVKAAHQFRIVRALAEGQAHAAPQRRARPAADQRLTHAQQLFARVQ